MGLASYLFVASLLLNVSLKPDNQPISAEYRIFYWVSRLHNIIRYDYGTFIRGKKKNRHANMGFYQSIALR